METTYYTLQVKLNNDKVHEFKNIEEANLPTVRANLWVQGVKIQSSPTAWQLISPLQIREAWLLKQERKFE